MQSARPAWVKLTVRVTGWFPNGHEFSGVQLCRDSLHTWFAAT